MQGGFPPPWLYDYVWCTLFLSSFQKMVLSSWFHLIIPPTYITNPHQSPHLKIPTSQETWCYCPLSGWECQLQPTQPKSWLTERTDVKRTGHDDCFVFLRWGFLYHRGQECLFIIAMTSTFFPFVRWSWRNTQNLETMEKGKQSHTETLCCCEMGKAKQMIQWHSLQATLFRVFLRISEPQTFVFPTVNVGRP